MAAVRGNQPHSPLLKERTEDLRLEQVPVLVLQAHLDMVCGPLEVLLTVDEEEGATGALGSKAGFSAVSLGIRGLAEGHSGMDIHAGHTPQEHADIPSVALLWGVLRRIIAGMSELEEIRRQG